MFLGIEIGGTKLQLGVGAGDGEIRSLVRERVDAAAGAEGIRRQLVQMVPALLAQAGLERGDIERVGIGFGGPVDADAGRVAKSHQIGGWENFPLADWCRAELGWPAIVHNDADTAGLAEACFGAGRGYSPIFYITIGSGIGGGLIIDQKIYRGAGAGAGEIGHMVLPTTLLYLRGRKHSTDSPLAETVELNCSGWAMAKRLREAIERFRRVHDRDAEQLFVMANRDLSGVDAQLVARAAEAGNPHALQVLAAECAILGWAIAQVITLLCPRRVVIGGGVSLLGEALLFEPLREQVTTQVFPPFTNRYEIVPAALGEAVAMHGALLLARRAAAGEQITV